MMPVVFGDLFLLDNQSIYDENDVITQKSRAFCTAARMMTHGCDASDTLLSPNPSPLRLIEMNECMNDGFRWCVFVCVRVGVGSGFKNTLKYVSCAMGTNDKI